MTTAIEFIESSKAQTPEKYILIPSSAQDYLVAMMDDYAELKIKEKIVYIASKQDAVKLAASVKNVDADNITLVSEDIFKFITR